MRRKENSCTINKRQVLVQQSRLRVGFKYVDPPRNGISVGGQIGDQWSDSHFFTVRKSSRRLSIIFSWKNGSSGHGFRGA